MVVDPGQCGSHWSSLLRVQILVRLVSRFHFLRQLGSTADTVHAAVFVLEECRFASTGR